MKQIPKWITENPTYAEDEEYMKIISNIMKADIEEDKNKIIEALKSRDINNINNYNLISVNDNDTLVKFRQFY